MIPDAPKCNSQNAIIFVPNHLLSFRFHIFDKESNCRQQIDLPIFETIVNNYGYQLPTEAIESLAKDLQIKTELLLLWFRNPLAHTIIMYGDGDIYRIPTFPPHANRPIDEELPNWRNSLLVEINKFTVTTIFSLYANGLQMDPVEIWRGAPTFSEVPQFQVARFKFAWLHRQLAYITYVCWRHPFLRNDLSYIYKLINGIVKDERLEYTIRQKMSDVKTILDSALRPITVQQNQQVTTVENDNEVRSNYVNFLFDEFDDKLSQLSFGCDGVKTPSPKFENDEISSDVLTQLKEFDVLPAFNICDQK